MKRRRLRKRSKAKAKSGSTAAAQENFDQATDSEIERERARRLAELRASHLKFVKQRSFHTSSTFMDYLHGDVKEDEQWFACHYEYTRESEAIWEAAKERDALQQADRQATSEQVALAVFKRNPGEWWVGDLVLLNFLICAAFPKKDWNQLSEAERNRIMGFSQRKKIPPLPMTDMWTLKALGVFDRFTKMGEKAKPVVKNVLPGTKGGPMKQVAPLLQQDDSLPVYYAVLNVDYSKGETQLVNEFREWLRLPENRKRLNKHESPKIGTTGKPLDRLKDLAAWRLYRELNNNWNAANAFTNRHRKHFTSAEIREKYKTKEQREKFQSGSAKPFRDAQKQDGKEPNEADLFGEDADGRKAQASAWKFLTDIMPQEFAPPGPAMLRAFVELEKRVKSG